MLMHPGAQFPTRDFILPWVLGRSGEKNVLLDGKWYEGTPGTPGLLVMKQMCVPQVDSVGSLELTTVYHVVVPEPALWYIPPSITHHRTLAEVVPVTGSVSGFLWPRAYSMRRLCIYHKHWLSEGNNFSSLKCYRASIRIK